MLPPEFQHLLLPAIVFLVLFIGVWSLLSLVSQRNTRTQERLERHSRPASLAEIEVPGKQSKEERFKGVKKVVEDLGGVLKPQTELEQSTLRIKLANAGFRSESAMGIYQGLRFGSFMLFTLVGVVLILILDYQLPFLPGYAWLVMLISL